MRGPVASVTRVFGRDAWLAVAILVLVPNLIFLALMPWLLVRRLLSPVIYLAAGVLAVFLPWPAGLAALLLASAIDALLIVALLFDMPLMTTLKSLRYFMEIDIAASALYAAEIDCFIAVPVVALRLVHRHRAVLRRAPLIPSLMAACGLAALDYQVNGFRPLSPPEFDSALKQNGMDAETIISRDRSLLIVLVEGLGAYARPEERELLAGRLRAAAGDRFVLKTGVSRYYGSTTGAESRELCGKFETFTHYLRNGAQDCLPRRLADAGYATASYHAARGRLFSRPVWYPRIGFQKLNFREEIEAERPQAITRLCGTVCTGLCDHDIGNIVRADLLAEPERRKLLYWLTLNSHVPYRPDPERPLACGTSEAAIPSKVACELTELWSGIFDQVADIARDPATPPVDILVVGDHATPMWRRDSFGHFVNGKVDWYLLEDTKRPASRLAELRGGF